MKYPYIASRNSVAVSAVIASVFSFTFNLSTTMAAEEKEDDSKGIYIPAGTPAKNFYVGIGFMSGTTDSPDSNQDGSVTNVSKDSTTTGSGVYFGYQINDFVAVQGAYQNLGEDSFSGVSSGGSSWAAGPVSTKHEAKGWEMGVMGRWPVAPRWYALGFMGIFKWESKETYNESGYISTDTKSGNTVTYAVGFEYDVGLKDRFLYRLSATKHDIRDDHYDVKNISGSLIYRFP